MTFTDEQIEKAAKAAYESRMQNLHMPSNWDRQHEWDRIVERRAARAALEAVTLEGEPVAWGAAYGGKIATISLTKTRHHTAPLYAHPAPEPGELERLREVAREAFRAFEAHWSSAGGSPEEHAKFMQHRRRFYELYEPFRAALAEGDGDE